VSDMERFSLTQDMVCFEQAQRNKAE